MVNPCSTRSHQAGHVFAFARIFDLLERRRPLNSSSNKHIPALSLGLTGRMKCSSIAASVPSDIVSVWDNHMMFANRLFEGYASWSVNERILQAILPTYAKNKAPLFAFGPFCRYTLSEAESVHSIKERKSDLNAYLK